MGTAALKMDSEPLAGLLGGRLAGLRGGVSEVSLRGGSFPQKFIPWSLMIISASSSGSFLVLLQKTILEIETNSPARADAGRLAAS